MQLCKTPVLPAQRVRLPAQSSRSVLVRATSVEQETRKEASSPSSSGAKEIYIGFPKNDYAPRAGRKGRVIIDDPSKYPAKADLGPLLGATGGWAGGEAALVKLKESIKAEMSQTASAPVKPQAADPTVIAPSGQPIYVGFGKDELELKKTGVTGRVIIDEPSKYPNKEDIGPLSGATGGFAGGERGLRAFVETGEVNIRKPGEPGGQPMSPLSIAFLMLLAGAGGAALLTQFSAVTDQL